MLLLALLSCTEPAPPAPSAAPPAALPPPQNVVLILIDTLRADALAEATTPNLDALAASGDTAHAWAACTWTAPSVVSLFTGMSVREHGWDLPTGRLGHYPPLPSAPTLASVLKGAGFTTTGLYANPYLAEELGFDVGFDDWIRTVDRAMPARLGKEVARWERGERHFVYLHLLGPHSPLRPSEAARQRWQVDAHWIDAKQGFGIGAAKRNKEPGVRQAYAAAYKAVIEDTDAIVGELLAALGPHRQDTLVIATSDHGELLGEHNRVGHGSWLYEGLTSVPLIIDRGELPQTLGTAAIPALITEAVGVGHAWPTPADAALPLVTQREGNVAMSADGQHKGIWMDGTLSVYDLQADPTEQRPLQADHGLPAALAAWQAQTPAGTRSEAGVRLSPETVEGLRALGYLE